MDQAWRRTLNKGVQLVSWLVDSTREVCCMADEMGKPEGRKITLFSS